MVRMESDSEAQLFDSPPFPRSRRLLERCINLCVGGSGTVTVCDESTFSASTHKIMLSSNAARPLRSLRALHTSCPKLFPRRRKEEIHNPHLPRFQATGLLLDGNEVEDEIDEDGQPVDINEPSSAVHLYLEQQREKLKYMRLIEHEVPLLARESLLTFHLDT